MQDQYRGMNRDDFVFTIGYTGNTAIVDQDLRRNFRKASSRNLFAAGLYKPAFAAALFDADEDSQRWIAEEYSKLSGTSYGVRELQRLFGVFSVPEGVDKVRAV